MARAPGAPPLITGKVMRWTANLSTRSTLFSKSPLLSCSFSESSSSIWIYSFSLSNCFDLSLIFLSMN